MPEQSWPADGRRRPAPYAHVAVQALVALSAVDACLGALDPATRRLAAGAARALQAMHTAPTVDGLIAKLETPADPAIHRLVFKALCRLDHREADYTGDWWTTRPDTRPLLQTRLGAEPAKIERALQEAVERTDKSSVNSLPIELVRNKFELKATAAVELDLAGLDPSNRAAMVDILAARRSLPDKAIRFLEGVAASDQESPAPRPGLPGLGPQRSPRCRRHHGGDRAPGEARLSCWTHGGNISRHRACPTSRRLASHDPGTRPRPGEAGYSVLLTVDAAPQREAGAGRCGAGDRFGG